MCFQVSKRAMIIKALDAAAEMAVECRCSVLGLLQQARENVRRELPEEARQLDVFETAAAAARITAEDAHAAAMESYYNGSKKARFD